MRICPNIQFADAKEERRQGERAFTMVEIAIAIGVIGFALVAVIGILPTGMNTQKDNREDNIISQDAPFFMDAIRNGSTNTFNNNNISTPNQGLDFLTNYVEKISFYGITNGVTPTNAYGAFSNFQNGAAIVGLLSTPQPNYFSLSNYTITRAIVRSLSGAAVQQNGANLATAFRYQMDVEVVPFASIAPDTTNYVYYQSLPNVDTNQVIIRSNRWWEAYSGLLAFNLYDVRLHFSWPVFPNGSVGPGRQNYRTMISSQLVRNNSFSFDGVYQPVWFFQPQFYSNTTTQPLL